MKKYKALILLTSLAMVLPSCSGGTKYRLTFHQENVNDKVVEVTKDKTTNEEVKKQEPSITPKEGYDASWVYDVTKMNSDLTINPTYTPIVYYATFIADGVQVGEKIPFTVETSKINEPEIPVKAGYSARWGDYQIKPQDMTINAIYALETYTLTFIGFDGEVAGTATFDVNNREVTPPPAPTEDQYNIKWEMESPLPLKNDTIFLSRVPCEYKVTFKVDGDVYAIKTYNIENKGSFKAPDVPNKPGYAKGTWESFSLDQFKDLEVNAIYSDVDLITYHANFYNGDTLVATRDFDVKHKVIDIPAVPEKPGYSDVHWEDFVLGASDIDIHTIGTPITYHITFKDTDGKLMESVPFTVETQSIQEPIIPEVLGKDGEFLPKYNLKTPADQETYLTYTAKKYYVSFYGGLNHETKVDGTFYYTVDNPTLNQIPQVPEVASYYGAWPKTNIDPKDPKDFDVNALYFNKVYDFEDEIIPECLVANNIVTGVSITENGVEGTKGLSVTVKEGDFKFGFDKTYLDAAFANSKVKAVAFDAKSNVATQNWRYCTPEGEPSSSPAQPYEDYETGAGLGTTYKTFYFTRKMYDSWGKNGHVSYMIQGATGGMANIDIDNVRPVDYDVYNNASIYGFETNTIKKNSGTEFSARRGAGKEAMKVSGAGVVEDSWSYSYDKKTEGNRSLKFSKQNGYIALYLNTDIIDAIPGDYVVFDIFTTSGFNSYDSNKGMCTGMNGALNRQTPANKWFTLAFKKNCSGTGDITTDGRFLILQGSTACDVYIDNIRGISKLDDLETSYAFHAGDYGYALDYKTEKTDAAGGTIRDVNKDYTFLVNGAKLQETEVTTEKSSTGNRSVKFTYQSNGYCALAINPLLVDEYVRKGFSISFDIWTSASFTGGTSFGDKVNPHVGEWTTVTITPEEFAVNSYNGYFFKSNFNAAGCFYVDNFQLVPPQN